MKVDKARRVAANDANLGLLNVACRIRDTCSAAQLGLGQLPVQIAVHKLKSAPHLAQRGSKQVSAHQAVA